MRHGLMLTVALLVATASNAGVRIGPHKEPARPVRASASAALFTGISTFQDERLADVRYAVDDAVDLAYVMAIARNPALVEPRHTVLALAGNPQKDESKRRLAALRAAGAALVADPGNTNILRLLEEQSRAVGEDGLLLVSFATHGISDGGTQYLLAHDSILQHRETAISETKLREIVSVARVNRALILLDACRERLTSGTRAGEADPRSAAALLRALGDVSGHVVLSAAAAGDYAYDDSERGNGVFTGAVIDALQCRAAADDRGYVTVDTLWSYVSERVLSWVREHRNPDARRATQLLCEGPARTMPLSLCGIRGTEQAPAPPPP